MSRLWHYWSTSIVRFQKLLYSTLLEYLLAQYCSKVMSYALVTSAMNLVPR